MREKKFWYWVGLVAIVALGMTACATCPTPRDGNAADEGRTCKRMVNARPAPSVATVVRDVTTRMIDICPRQNSKTSMVVGRTKGGGNLLFGLKVGSAPDEAHAYLLYYVSDHIETFANETSNAFEVGKGGANGSCIVRLDAVEKYGGAYELLTSILAPDGDTVKDYLVHGMDTLAKSPDYLAYKERNSEGLRQRYRPSVTAAHLRVVAVNVAETADAMVKTGSVTHSGSTTRSGSYDTSDYGGGTATTETQSQGTTTHTRYDGFQGSYPTQQKVVINGRDFRLDQNKVFFDGIVSPGPLQIVASFREGFGDDAAAQFYGDHHKKTVRVDVRRNDDIKIELAFVCTPNEKDIQIRTLRKKRVKQGRVTETVWEAF